MRDESSDAVSSLRLRVECHAGYRGEETPRRFFLHERRFEVRELLDCWLGPDHRYFKLIAEDGGVYILRHDTARDHWELTMFAAPGFLDGPDRHVDRT